MIFVTLGTQKFQLNRLLRQIDIMIENGEIKEPVIAQVGNSDYSPRHYKYQPFFDKDEMGRLMRESSLVITHGGVGSIIQAMQCKTPIIVFPRLAKYREHVDDHQLDIARVFSLKNYVLVCQDEKQLADSIAKAKSMHFDYYHSQRKRMVNTIQSYMLTVENTALVSRHA